MPSEMTALAPETKKTARRNRGAHGFELPDGTPVPSVTTILGNLGWKSYGLMYWAWNLGKQGKDFRDERDKAAEVGTVCHAWASADIAGKPKPAFDLPEDMAKKAADSFQAYLDWRAMTRLDLIATELALVSARWKFGGRLDAIAVWEGAPRLIDFKSSKSLYPDQIVQIAAYVALWNEHKPDMKIAGADILRWAPDGSFVHHAFTLDKLRVGWQVFAHALALHQLKGDLK